MRNQGVEILFDYTYSGGYGLISKTFLSKPIRLFKDSMSISFYWGLVVVILSICRILGLLNGAMFEHKIHSQK